MRHKSFIIGVCTKDGSNVLWDDMQVVVHSVLNIFLHNGDEMFVIPNKDKATFSYIGPVNDGFSIKAIEKQLHQLLPHLAMYAITPVGDTFPHMYDIQFGDTFDEEKKESICAEFFDRLATQVTTNRQMYCQQPKEAN